MKLQSGGHYFDWDITYSPKKKVTTFKDHHKTQRNSDQSQHRVFISYFYWDVWFKISRSVSLPVPLDLGFLFWKPTRTIGQQSIESVRLISMLRSFRNQTMLGVKGQSIPWVSPLRTRGKREGQRKRNKDVLQRRLDTTDTNSKSKWVLLW